MEMTKSPTAMTDWLMSPLQSTYGSQYRNPTTDSMRHLPVVLREWPVLNVGHSRGLGCSMGEGKQDRLDTRTSVLSTDFLINTTRLLDMRIGSLVLRSLPSARTEPYGGLARLEAFQLLLFQYRSPCLSCDRVGKFCRNQYSCGLFRVLGCTPTKARRRPLPRSHQQT